jgi:hypothetical protein
LNATTSILKGVYAQDDIIFIDTSFDTIFSAEGGVFCRNSFLDTSNVSGNSIDA